jgi:hypothetical protein
MRLLTGGSEEKEISTAAGQVEPVAIPDHLCKLYKLAALRFCHQVRVRFPISQHLRRAVRFPQRIQSLLYKSAYQLSMF